MSFVLRAEASAKFPFRMATHTDHKCWAKRILYRHEKNDSSLTQTQVMFAKQAMGIPLDTKPKED